MEEIWKDIPNYIGFYQVSNFGNVKSLDRFVKRSPSGYNKKGIMLKLHINNNGYAIIDLKINKTRRKKTVHGLVAAAFIGKRPDGFDLNHINGIKTDNRPENLEYLTRSDNMKHAFSIGLRSNVGENSSRAILTENDVQNIRTIYTDGKYTHRSLAKKYGVSKGAITAILLRYNWKHI